MTFGEWLNITFYEDFETTDLTEAEYYELEVLYNEEI